jgi:hypothetical protein
LIPFPQDDQRQGNLAPLLIQPSDNGAFQYGRMAIEDLLNFQGRDVFPPADDNILFPILHDQLPVRLQGAEIARMIPSAFEGLGRLPGLGIIPLHDHVSPDK